MTHCNHTEDVFVVGWPNGATDVFATRAECCSEYQENLEMQKAALHHGYYEDPDDAPDPSDYEAHWTESALDRAGIDKSNL